MSSSASQTDHEQGPGEGRQRAIALKYDEGDQAPWIVACGAGEIARQILRLAEQNKVPIQRNDTLVDVLGKLDVGYEIPPETYRIVAEILAFLYRTDSEWRRRKETQFEPLQVK